MADAELQEHVARKLERVMAQPVEGLGRRLRAALGIDELEEALSTDGEKPDTGDAARKRLHPGALPTPPPRVRRNLELD